MIDRRIAEFDESDDALRFCKMKGEDYTVCGGVQRMWAVRPKSRRELGYSGVEPNDSYVDEDQFYEDDE